jgi:fatty-acyl-CoA synthase
VRVAGDDATAFAQVPCGQVARSLWAVIVDTEMCGELPDSKVGEVWLHGNNIGRGYWGRPDETEQTFRACLGSRLDAGTHAEGVPAQADWLRTGDLGVYLDGELYVLGRLADLVVVDGRQHYPDDIESAAEQASPMVRRGHVTAFTVTAAGTSGPAEQLVIVAERASGTGRADPAPAAEAIRTAVARRHHITVADVCFVPAGAIPRTTSGKLARRACRAQYLSGVLAGSR